MRRFYLTGLLMLLTAGLMAQEIQPVKRKLDMVFCIDLSGSTNGIINDVRNQFWLMVNQVQYLEPAADLRIGVVAFGRPSFGKENAYIRVISNLTTDYDHIIAELYRLKPSIEKGDQFVDRALSVAVNRLAWSKEKNAFKVIYVMGNGMVSGSGFEYVKTCEAAVAKNIIVNSLYIQNNSNQYKELPAWRRIATITGGTQSEISIGNNDTITWMADFEQIHALNQKLNSSFLWSGRDSSICRRALATADSGARAAGTESYYHRILYKTSEQFRLKLTNCERVAATHNRKLAVTHSGYIADSNNTLPFENRMGELQKHREECIVKLREALSNHRLSDYKTQYADNVQFNSIFHFSVLNILLRQWNPQ